MFLQPKAEFKLRNAKEFFDYIQSALSNLYLFTSKSTSWDDDLSPDEIQFTDKELRDVWDEISYLKKVLPGDVKFGIRKIEWESGRVYQQYDDTIDLRDKDYYVFTPENNVYLCVGNNLGSPSTQKPIHSTENIVILSDGYAWKFIANIDVSLLNKFIVDDFIPFEIDQQIVDGALPGTIEKLVLEDGGFGYEPDRTIENGNELSVFIQGNGIQVGNAIASVAVSQGQIVSTTITDPGNGYTFGPGIPFAIAFRQITSSGINQTAYGIGVTNLQGEISTIDVINRGQGYSSGFVTVIQSSAEGFAETDSLGRVVNVGMRVGTTGENFRKATATVIGTNLTGEEAQIRPIIGPEGGYGADPLLQLAAHNLLISVPFDQVELDEFRQIGLIDNPINFGVELDSDGLLETGQDLFLSLPLADAKYRLVLNESNDFFEDGESIRGVNTGVFGRNIQKLNSDIIRYNADDSLFDAEDFSFEVGEQIVGISSGAVATVAEVIDPDVEKYSGQLYHINNFKPTLKTEEQQVLVTFALKY